MSIESTTPAPAAPTHTKHDNVQDSSIAHPINQSARDLRADMVNTRFLFNGVHRQLCLALTKAYVLEEDDDEDMPELVDVPATPGHGQANDIVHHTAPLSE
ncbi:hypothetical protein C8Q76DRAFT_792561 [Earliella scabrosa]|nr:hypothetical protein C8Q76DRAFT_792561 [Earliella scabrosa]